MAKSRSSAPRIDALFRRLSLILLSALVLLLASPAAMQAQTYPDLGHSLYAHGYTGTVWVNSFDTHQSRLAHGLFYPDTPFSPIGNYEARYGMGVTGSGTVSVDTDGFYMATGTATNPNAIDSDGSISIDLISGGNAIDGVKVNFVCGPSATCPWTAHFLTRPTVPNPTVRVYRHVEGSNCGGELSIDLNGDCRAALIAYFQLPLTYHFTTTDNIDTNYVSKPGANTSSLCAVILPVCSGAPPPPPPAPVSAFTWSPATVYAGSPVTFTDQSTNGPTIWSWNFQGGSPASASVVSPIVTFSSLGPKTVTLMASNPQGPGTLATKILTVLDSNPAGTVTASAASVTQCQAVTFTANATGLPPLTYSWQVLDPNSTTVNPPGIVPGTSTFSWTSLPALAPGTYTGQVTVKNSVNTSGVVLSKQIQLTPLPALTDISGSAPTTDPFVANSVKFTAPSHNGATKWVWDYGDGNTDTITDPVQGPGPTHVYAAIGTYNAKVTISNCMNLTGSTSQTVSVHVTQTTPLVAAFQASLFCQLGQCFTTAGTAVGFNDTSQGAEHWDYDWAHTGTDPQTCNFTDSGHTSPVLSHTYATAGTFQPCLQVRRGASEKNVALHGFAIVVSPSGPPPPPPTITVTGNNSGQINTPYIYSGFATSCTANGTGWVWTVAGGGIIAGVATGSQITVTWATTGTKSVSATNSGCSGAQGSQTVSINTGGGGGPLAAQFTFLPASPKTGDNVSFDSSPSTGVPAGASISWSFGDGGSASGATATHVYTTAGSYNAQLSISQSGCLNPTCSSTVAKTVTVTAGDSNSGGAQFTVTPASPSATQAATFDASSSTNLPAGSLVGWDFGDGSPSAFGTLILHAFAAPGSYHVVVAISPPGCTTAACLALASKTVVVGPPPPVSADFSTDATCTSQFGIDQCQAVATTVVSLTATAADATIYAWDFGDGTTGSGRQVTHTWAQPGNYSVSLTAVKGSAAATKIRNFVLSPAPAPQTKTTLLPLVTQSRGVLVQSNDLYVYNPGTIPLDVTLEFRKRGTPDVNPPRATRTLQPGATLYAPDVLSSLFSVENVAGFVNLVTGVNSAEPVVTSFNSKGATANKLFGLTIPGTSVSSLGSASVSGPLSSSQFLVGLHDSPDRQSSFGFSNPADETATYHLRFFDKSGQLLTESSDLTLSGHDQRQYSVQEIRDSFGINNLDDYRVEVKTVSGAQVFPFGSDIRVVTGDPSFTEAGSYTSPRLYLLGVFTGAGAAKSTWQTDLLLSNVSDQVLQTTLSYTAVSNKSVKSSQVTVQPGATERLENALFSQFGLRNGTGVITLTSTSPNGIFPIARAESYDNTNPAKRYGQSLLAMSDADAADTTKREILVGLRQDGANKTTLWIFNPSGVPGVYDVVYRGLNGAVLGTLPGIKIGAGQLRQISPSQHPLKKAGVAGGFTVEVKVKSGKALAAAQVVRAGTNDPAFVAAEVR